MKTKSIIFLLTFLSFPLFAQKFSFQLNSGYKNFIGTKISPQSSENNIPTLGSFTSSVIPVGVEIRYFITDEMFVNLSGSYGIDLGYQSLQDGLTYLKTKINPYNINLGMGYFFINQDKIKIYGGLDFSVIGVRPYLEYPSGRFSNLKTQYSNSNTIGLSPKVGADFYFTKNLFLNLALNYSFIFSKVRDKEVDVTYSGIDVAILEAYKDIFPTTQKGSFDNSHAIGIDVGLGFKF